MLPRNISTSPGSFLGVGAVPFATLPVRCSAHNVSLCAISFVPKHWVLAKKPPHAKTVPGMSSLGVFEVSPTLSPRYLWEYTSPKGQEMYSLCNCLRIVRVLGKCVLSTMHSVSSLSHGLIFFFKQFLLVWSFCYFPLPCEVPFTIFEVF